jgi:hypothetical protein
MCACAVHTTQPIDDDLDDFMYRQKVLAGMKSETFPESFFGEFSNLRKAIFARDWVEVEETIQALEACAVNVCNKYDAEWLRNNQQ